MDRIDIMRTALEGVFGLLLRNGTGHDMALMLVILLTFIIIIIVVVHSVSSIELFPSCPLALSSPQDYTGWSGSGQWPNVL